MTIGQGIADGGHNYLERMEKARQFDESLAEKRREADQQAFVSLANAPRARLDNSSEELAEKRRQFDESQKLKQQELDMRADQYDQAHSWDDALNQQRLDTLKAQQDEYAARMSHYQQLEAQTRQYAADLKESRHTTMKDMFWMARNNGGFLTSPELLGEFTQRFQAPDLAGITTAGFFYNEDGTVKSPENDDNKPAKFGISYNYIDHNTGKVAVDKNGNRTEKVLIPKFQDEWVSQGQFYGYGKIGGASGSGLSFEERQQLEDQRQRGRVELAGMNNGSRERISSGNNATKKEVSVMQTASREKIAAGHDQTRLELADISAALKQQGFEVDEAKLAEAIRHNKATEAATAGRDAETGRHHKATEDAAIARTEERTRHNKATEEVQQQRADTQAQRVEDQYELGDRKQTHNENRLENDKAQKEADRQLKRELADLRARTRRAESHSTSTPSRIKEINSELTALEKIIANGKPEDRKNAKARMSALSDELSGNGGDKATIKSGDNTHDEGTQEPPNGEYHTVKDGVSYHWGKSKSGKYGYFPDK